MTETDQPMHHETVTSRIPPTVFGSARGPLRLGALALPSETISIASLLTTVALFAGLSFNETGQYFFRMKAWWAPPALSAAGLIFSLAIMLVGIKRPGPAGPRLWVLWMVALNVLLTVAGLAAGLLPPVATGSLPAVPPWLADPFPLHALSISVAAGSVVLLARLRRVHPMYLSVLLAAPVTLVAVLVPVAFGAFYYISSQERLEKETLENMAASLNRAAGGLGTAAHFDYIAAAGDEDDERRVEEALTGLALPDELPLPDSRRWYAAGVLERSGAMTPGHLQTSVRGLIDAIGDAAIPDLLPPVRAGRFRLRNDGTYVDAPESAFERAVGRSLRYHRSAAEWLPLLARLQQGPVAEHAAARRRDLDARLAPMRRRGDTAWRAWQTELVDELNPPGRLAEVLKLPIGIGDARSASEVQHWTNLSWRRAFALRGPGGPCDTIGPRVVKSEPIIAPDDRLTPEQLEERKMGLAEFYIGTRINAFSVLRCFTYHPPFGAAVDPDDFVVTEMRLSYSVEGRELLETAPCRKMPCGRGAALPAATMPATVELLVDVPPQSGANYADAVSRVVSSALSKGTVGGPEPHTQPDGRSAVRFLLKAQ